MDQESKNQCPLTSDVYCTNVAKTILFAFLSSKATSAVVSVWYQWLRNFLCGLEVAVARCVGMGVQYGEGRATGEQVPIHNSIVGNFKDTGARWNDRGIAPCPFEKGATGAEVRFHNRITDNFMVFQDQLETNCSYSRTIKFRMVFYNFCYYFSGRPKHCCCPNTSTIGNDFCFIQVSIALNSFTAPPCPTAVPASLTAAKLRPVFRHKG